MNPFNTLLVIVFIDTLQYDTLMGLNAEKLTTNLDYSLARLIGDISTCLSRSNEKTGRQPPGESNNNLQPAQRDAIQLAYPRARSKSRLASLSFALFQVYLFYTTPHFQTCFRLSRLTESTLRSCRTCHFSTTSACRLGTACSMMSSSCLDTVSLIFVTLNSSSPCIFNQPYPTWSAPASAISYTL
jgi:hypothetical protein